ncbi:MAG: hypothetical protein QF879_11150 [Candidatus Latescibacteria bacterium]|nr:hypothetical protein [Candidatus Latescibacterota bacterium]MDP7235258.1 hypothetical protein [Candidatus Latescibacterota bacterium]
MPIASSPFSGWYPQLFRHHGDVAALCLIVFFDSEPQRRPDLDKIFIRVVAMVCVGCVRIGAVFEQQSCDIDMAAAGGDGQRVRIGLKII